MQYLVGTDSIHTTAAICDYLEERASGDDAVTVVAVAPADDPTARRDCEEALNVAPVRLATVGEVETEVRTGDPVAELRDAATASAADELVVGAHSGDPEATRDLGSTARGLLADADRPVVVVPIPVL
ncbi:UspA domain-containing protein [Natrinema pellirubrum DSM 15624]|uniref:Universal stress protein UspA-like protein n=1 Tax=Natrinema pellirubrum (strain DSM 15624 / CIP 106293 / JCM 10476 / NCIMB 786 / 157) TaxID=797303 RepID=L0JIY1_NATP1|nr:universal stress protein [Natrinema pellirubrum]AGB31269.1 universal stress protein UspA-like protein [Natrinema pellirubrum DSM 15624]ELY81793.1 UspA domain-containing protein [Natrinema pellirubrum DSM 15624]